MTAVGTGAVSSPTQVGDQRMLVDGEWCAAAQGRTIPIVNPATEEEIGTLPDASAADVDAAVGAAAAAFADGEGAWPQTPVAERRAALGRVLDTLAARTEAVAMAEVANGGLTIRAARGFVAVGGPIFMRGLLDHAPDEEWNGLPLESLPSVSANYLRREPIGVVAALPPSNAGYWLGLYKTVAALVTGNTVVMKPSPLNSLSCIEIAKAVAEEPMIPSDAFHLVLGDVEAGSALSGHPLVDLVAFTGASTTGARVMEAAAANLTRVALELGGKGPAIVLDDAVVDDIVDGITFGFLNQTGQACTSGTRLLVPEALHDDLVAKLSARVQRLRVGDPLDMETDLGPVVSAAQRDKIEAFVGRARKEATLVCGGERPELRGFYAQPTIFTGVTNAMELARDEVFGPVLAVIRYSDDDEAVRVANDTAYGLTGTVWGTSNARALAIARRLRAGTVWINDHHQISSNAPFGGYKASGLGRVYGTPGLETFTELKHLHIDLHGRDDRMAYASVLGH